MVEFHWRTTGTRDFRGLEICRLPPAAILLIIIALAVGVTVLLTGKVTEQEEHFQVTQARLESIQQAKLNIPNPGNR